MPDTEVKVFQLRVTENTYYYKSISPYCFWFQTLNIPAYIMFFFQAIRNNTLLHISSDCCCLLCSHSFGVSSGVLVHMHWVNRIFSEEMIHNLMSLCTTNTMLLLPWLLKTSTRALIYVSYVNLLLLSLANCSLESFSFHGICDFSLHSPPMMLLTSHSDSRISWKCLPFDLHDK